MYNGTTTDTFIPLVADTWPGYSVNKGHWIKALHRSNATENATLHSYGIYPPASAEETWVFHIRENVKWQNNATKYGVTVKPSDVAYSIQSGMLQDAGTGVQWLLYTPLTGAGPADSLDPMFDKDENGVINQTEYNNYLGPAVKNAVGYNDATGYVWFNLPAPYAPLMQILTQAWAFVLNKQWCIERGCIDLDLALSYNYTEFYAHWQPTASPLMDSAVIGSAEPMMGSGPYKLVTYNSDPHVGFQAFQAFAGYWGGWSGNHVTYATIKCVEEWANRKAQFFSTDPALQVDFADVPQANAPELHQGGLKDNPTIPGFRLTKYYPQVIGSIFFCYNISSPSDFMPKIGTSDAPLFFRDRDLRLAFMYCLNVSQYMIDYWLGEAIQPTSILAKGTAYYNDSKPTYSIDIAKATALFQSAWGGQIWHKGMTVKLVYNTGNLARQTALSMMATVITTRIPWPSNITVTVTPTAEPWSVILPAMEDHSLPQFCIGWMADFPDPADWFIPFMDPAGTYSGISQVIEYGLDPANMALKWSAAASYGPPPYTNALGEYVTGINNTYVHHLNMVALAAASDIREKLYNEMMDIYYAECGGEALYQATARHYERDWINGWVGGYSNNPIAVGHYFYQIWKGTALPIYGVDMSAVGSITNTTKVYPLIQNYHGEMRWMGLAAKINYSLHVTYVGPMEGPTIWIAIYLTRHTASITYFYVTITVTVDPGESVTITVTWYEKTITNEYWTIDLEVSPVGTAGGEVYDMDTTNNQINSPYNVTIKSWSMDINGDGKIDIKDLVLLIKAYGTVPGKTRWNADADVNKDGKVDIKDLVLLIKNYGKIFS
jgi:peptide/nickel transport system substrate-binding protein